MVQFCPLGLKIPVAEKIISLPLSYWKPYIRRFTGFGWEALKDLAQSNRCIYMNTWPNKRSRRLVRFAN